MRKSRRLSGAALALATTGFAAMADGATDKAIESARAELGLESTSSAQAYVVANLAQPGGDYFLVVFHKNGKDIAIATVGRASYDVMSHAQLTNVTAHLVVSAKDARALAGSSPDADVHLVWRPGVATKSMFYPVWKVTTSTGPLYVNQEGNLYETIMPLLSPGG